HGEGLGGVLECSLRETFVEIEGQDVGAIAADIGFGIGLAGPGGNNPHELFLGKGPIAFDTQTADTGLNPFTDDEAYKEIAFFALVVVVNLGGDGGGRKAVGAVEAFHGDAVVFQQAAAEFAARAESGFVNLQTTGEEFRIEIVVPGDSDAQEFV